MSVLSTPLNPAALRHESALTVDLMGVKDIREFDFVTQTRIQMRDVTVSAMLDSVSTPYNFPFSPMDSMAIWPGRSEEERLADLKDIQGMATDAIRLYVLGDLFSRAAQRDPQFLEKAKLYYSQAKELVEACKLSIKNAISRSNSGGGTGDDTSTGGGMAIIRIKLPGGPGNRRRQRGQYGQSDWH